MKKFKKISALLLAVMMVLGMSTSVFAASITLTAKEGHTYQIYQIFTGKVDADGKTLTELKYGKNAATGTEGATVSPEDLKALKKLSDKNLTDEHAIIAAYTPYVNLDSTPYETVTGAAVTNLTPGYYVIRDKNDTVPADKPLDDITLYMFQVLNSDLSISAKSGTVEAEKHVDDINDSTKEESKLKDSADYEIGDTIPYTLTFKLPEDYARYETYYVKFSDDMCEGLTLNPGSVEIAYGTAAKQKISFAEANSTKYTGGKLYTYEVTDLKTVAKNLKAGDVITITYTAYLNEKAKFGKAGNPNTYFVNFDNNPNKSGDGDTTGKTPDDTNIVFTYKSIFNKVDEAGKALAGADFKLEKLVDGQYVDVTTLGTSAHPKKVGSSEKQSKTFEFQGLDDGQYRLTETFTPEGYNTIQPIEFTITAEHELVSDNPILTSLLATGLEMEADTVEGTLTSSIINKSGAVLPSTGGIGTTMFYIVGAILAVGAGILLVTKRRMDAQ